MTEPLLENKLYNLDALEGFTRVADKSVDLIFTSPPHISETKYKKLADFKRFQEKFVAHFSRVISDKGFVVVCQSNHRYGGAVVSNYALYYQLFVDAGLTLKDEKIVYRRPPVGRKDLYRFTYQMLTLWTRKGGFKRAGEFMADTLIDNQGTLKGTTHWTPAFCDLVIKAVTKKDDFVLDPFAGNAVVLASAQRNGRRFIGFEMSEAEFKVGETALEAK